MKFEDLCSDINNLGKIDETLIILKNLIKEGLDFKRKLNVWYKSDEIVQDILLSNNNLKEWYENDNKRSYNTIFEIPREFNTRLKTEIFHYDTMDTFKSMQINDWCENNTITGDDIVRYYYYTTDDINVENGVHNLLNLLREYNFDRITLK